MSLAREVLDQFFNCLRDLNHSVDRIVDLFAADGASEFPYLATLGLPNVFKGPAEIRGVWELISSKFSAFEISNVEIYQTSDPTTLIVEYRAEGTVLGTGKYYAQNYISRHTVENGKIKRLREYLDVIESARAILPNGLADVPAARKAS